VRIIRNSNFPEVEFEMRALILKVYGFGLIVAIGTGAAVEMSKAPQFDDWIDYSAITASINAPLNLDAETRCK